MKLYIVIKHCIYDYESEILVLSVGTDHDAAVKTLKEYAKPLRREANKEGWIIKAGKESFQAYEDGYAAKDSYSLSITEIETDMIQPEVKPKSTGERLRGCIDTLNEIRTSGYWPFASPNPCSTECRIKEGINKAVSNLEYALANHEQEFGKGNLNEIGPHQTIIEQKA